MPAELPHSGNAPDKHDVLGTLIGRQEGAELGYNPSKPMRSSLLLHTFLVADLRLVAQQFAREDWSRADHPGCQRVEALRQLHG